jgi:type VI secretion system protein ImpM
VSQILIDMPPAPPSTRSAIGFYGKIPARGDFVRAGLPGAFISAWDDWMGRMIGASRAALGEDWARVWRAAAVQRFALTAGVCGPDAAIGMWLPSEDRVGRHFPLTVAAVGARATRCELLRDDVFLAAAEAAGREAIENRLPPEELSARVAMLTSAARSPPDVSACRADGASWWTEGVPRRSAKVFCCPGLPDEHAFIAMLTSCSPPPAFGIEPAL